MAAKKPPEPLRTFRKVTRGFDGYEVGLEVDCTDWPNTKELVSTGYLSSDYRTVESEDTA